MNTISIIVYYSVLMNFDPAISLAVARQESNFNNQTIGSLGELGVFQIRPEFITNYTKEELQNQEINIKVGIELLKEARKLCKHKENLDWLSCYNYGVVGGNKLKSPQNTKYVIGVNKFYREYLNAYANSLFETRKLACL